MDKYNRLHAAGVVHVSASPKHWLRPAGAPISALRLIDFGTSCVLDREGVPAGLRAHGRVMSAGVFAINVLAEVERVKNILQCA